MSNRILFVTATLLMGCSDPKPKPGTQNLHLYQDSASRNNAIDSNKAHITQKFDTLINCHHLLHSFINKSSFDPEITKLGFGVWVDTVFSGIAIIQITVHNTERNDDPTIGSVKIDFNTRKLWDISSDTATELSYDTALFRQLDEKCLVK